MAAHRTLVGTAAPRPRLVLALAAHWRAERLPALRYSLERSAGWSPAGASAAGQHDRCAADSGACPRWPAPATKSGSYSCRGDMSSRIAVTHRRTVSISPAARRSARQPPAPIGRAKPAGSNASRADAPRLHKRPGWALVGFADGRSCSEGCKYLKVSDLSAAGTDVQMPALSQTVGPRVAQQRGSTSSTSRSVTSGRGATTSCTESATTAAHAVAATAAGLALAGLVAAYFRAQDCTVWSRRCAGGGGPTWLG